MCLSEKVRVLEKRPIADEPTIIAGLPDVGLVGVIASLHVISSLKMEEVGIIDSELLPPIIVLQNGLPVSPLRFMGDKDGKMLVIVSETAIPAGAVYQLSKAIVDWAYSKKAKLVVSLGGIAVQDRQNIEEPKVFAMASDEEMLNLLKEKGFRIIDRGYIVGPYALIMKYCSLNGIPAIGLLAESFLHYPDPEAAASALLNLNKLLGLDIDVSKLKERGEEIRLAARDMMKRTRMEMARMRKSQEYDVPPLLV